MKHRNLWHAGIVVALTMLPSVAMADAPNPFQQAGSMTNAVGANAGLKSTPLPDLAGRLINVTLSFLGIVLLGYLLYGGYKYMTSGGDSKGADAGMSIIRNAIIGLIIIVAAFAISNFVLGSLVNATNQ